jgi:hypothetical protein
MPRKSPYLGKRATKVRIDLICGHHWEMLGAVSVWRNRLNGQGFCPVHHRFVEVSRIVGLEFRDF